MAEKKMRLADLLRDLKAEIRNQEDEINPLRDDIDEK